MHARWLIVAILVAVLGPPLVGGANRALDAAFQDRAQPPAPLVAPTPTPEACAPALPASLDDALRAIVPGGTAGPDASRRMAELFQADQLARSMPSFPAGTDIAAADRERRVEVLGYLVAGQLQSPPDLVAAAFIFQHGNCPEHYLLANRLAQIAMEAGDPDARWIYAATLDRYLMSRGNPQKYGTQYVVVDGRYELYPVDPATTDEERQRYNVPPLAEAQARAGAMPVGGTVVARALLSWWLTWAGLGYALLGMGAIALVRKVGLGQIALAAAGLVYLGSIAGHAAEVLAFDRAQLPLQIALGVAAAGLLVLLVLETIALFPRR